MKVAEATAWFDQIAQQRPPIEKPRQHDSQGHSEGWLSTPTRPTTRRREEPQYYVQDQATRWITDADSAIKSVFPPGHAVVKQWDTIRERAGHPGAWRIITTFDTIRAVFESAHAQLKDGRIAGLVESIRAESVSELLDQAEALLVSNYLAAATVIAGGAVESHLKHLCERNALTWQRPGSISRYDMALAQARNSGNEIISATDSRLVSGWGGMRNQAAHGPGQFTLSPDQVRLMIDGIRDFVARRT